MAIGDYVRVRCHNNLVHQIQHWGNGGWTSVCSFDKEKDWSMAYVAIDEPLTCLACIAFDPRERRKK